MTRLAVTIATTTAVLLLVVIVATYLLAGRQLRVQLDKRLEQQAIAIAGDVDPEDANDPVALAEDLWGEADPPPFDAQLLRRDGTVAVSSGAVPGGEALIDQATIASILDETIGRGTSEVGEELLRLHVRAVPPTDLVLVVANDLAPVTEPRRALLSVLLPVGVLGVLGLAAMAWAAIRRSLRPLGQMTQRAEIIGMEDLAIRLPTSSAHDEVDRLSRTVNRTLDRLAALIERERRFTADASHELRTPLSILRAELELAEVTADERTRMRLRSAQEEVDRLAGLIDDLLALARADADRLDSHERIDLRSLVSTIQSRFAPLATRKNIHLTASGAGQIFGERRGLDRALSNLTDNALRHTPRGGRVRLDATADHSHVRMTVTDNGPGVPDDRLDRLFDRFTRTDDARTGGGAGLGLAIVATVARAHKGSVTARNRSEGGLEIEILLASVAEPAESPNHPQPALRPTEGHARDRLEPE